MGLSVLPSRMEGVCLATAAIATGGDPKIDPKIC